MAMVQMYRSKSGKLFDTSFDEARDDLRTLIAELVENDAIAEKLTAKLSNGKFPEFRAIVERMWWNRLPDASKAAIDATPFTTSDFIDPAKFCPHGVYMAVTCHACESALP